jgi:tRNA threonylcarbamoyl adenosine modification protein YeaZ
VLILGIDTSSPATSLAILEFADGETPPQTRALFHQLHDHPPSDAAFPILEGMLREAQLEISQIDRFAVCVGPGSFTGLRIGLGMAKAFAWSLSRPVHGFDALHVIAARAQRAGLIGEDESANVLFTAMRGSAFTGRYRRCGAELQLQGELQHADHVAEALAKLNREEALIVRAGEELPEDAGAKPHRVDTETPTAVLVAEMAFAASRTDDPGLLDLVQPRYLKPFSIGKKANTRKDLAT